MPPHTNPAEVFAGKFDVDAILSVPASSWDQRISRDLIAEMEIHLSDKTTTLPEMRRILAVKGYQVCVAASRTISRERPASMRYA
jgi:hypothetical protein